MNLPSRPEKGSTNTTLTKLTIAEQVAAALRHEIATGQLSAGTRLPQIEIAQRFGPTGEAYWRTHLMATLLEASCKRSSLLT